MAYTARLHTTDEYDGLVRMGATPKEAADNLAWTLTGYTDIPYTTDIRCNVVGTGSVYRRYAPNLGHRVTITTTVAG